MFLWYLWFSWRDRQCIKKQRHHFAYKVHIGQSYGSSSSHVWTWELDHKEGQLPKYWCFWKVVLEKTLESPLDRKEIKPINPKGNQLWIFIGRTDAGSWSSNILATWCEQRAHWKRPWCWGRLRAGGEEVTEDKMAGWHHQLNGHESELRDVVKDRGAWHAAVHGVAKSRTWLSDRITTNVHQQRNGEWRCGTHTVEY